MTSLSTLLWLVEILLVPTTLIGLVRAATRGRRVRRWVALSLFTALTVAQPFGIVAHRVRTLPVAKAGTPDGDTSIHVARLLGIPVLPFIPYVQPKPIPDENVPSATVKARSWFWLPILTNGATIVSECDQSIFRPCWHPNDPTSYSQVSLAARSGSWYLTARPAPNTPVPAFQRSEVFAGTWKLNPGIASTAGALYWAALFCLLTGLRSGRLRARRRDPVKVGPTDSAPVEI